MLSVIIPIYNGASTLGEQLNALMAQEYEGQWEIIAVDNRSTDDSVQVIQRYQVMIPHLRLVYARDKQSKGYAVNVGVRAARGHAFIFCDQDDVVAPGWLAAFARALQGHDFVAGSLEESLLNQTSPSRPIFGNGTQKRVLGFLPHASGCNSGISRQALEAVGGFSEDFPISDDVDLSWRLQLHGYTLHDAPDAIVHYRYRKSYWGLWRQIQGYAEAQTHLYCRFAPHGMPRSSGWNALRNYGWVVRRLPSLFLGPGTERARWIFKAATCWGRLKGSIRYRTFYL